MFAQNFIWAHLEKYFEHDITELLVVLLLVLQHGHGKTSVCRWMNKTGGWVWIASEMSLVSKQNPDGNEKAEIVCVNTVFR